MSNIQTILVAVCGLGGACCGTVILGFFLVGRLTGGSLLVPALSMLGAFFFRDKEDKNDDGEEIHRPARRFRSDSGGIRPTRDLLNLDFDAAVQRHQKQKRGVDPDEQQRPRPMPKKTSNQDFGDFEPSGLRSNQNRPRRDTRRSGREGVDDEIMGGLLDEDGDSFPDF